MNINKLAERFTKTSRWVFLGEEKVSIKRFTENKLETSFPSIAAEFRIIGLPMSKQLEIAEKLLTVIPVKGSSYVKKTARDKADLFFSVNKLFTNRSDSKETIVYNIDERVIDPHIDPVVYLRLLSKDERMGRLLNMEVAQVEYDAYDITPISDIVKMGVPIKKLNLYSPPRWRKEYEHTDKTWNNNPPELFKRFFDFLVPDKKEQEMVISWVCHALTSRHHNYLVLRGNRGNGKTIFMKVLMGVIGNSYLALDGVAKDFNADMKNKRIIGIDDDPFIGSREGEKVRKRIINTRVTFNEKHKQTTESEQQFASYILCSNPSDRFFVRYDERRLIQVTLGKGKLEDAFSHKERDFLDRLSDGDEGLTPRQLKFLAQLGHWLLGKSRTRPHECTHCYLGGTFWSDVIDSLSGFERYVVELILSKDKVRYSYSDLVYYWKEEKTSAQKIPSWSTFKHFLETFQFKGSSMVSDIDNKDKTFDVSEEYTPVDDEEFYEV